MNICVNCKKTDGPLKTCTACRSVRYCGVDCQRSHRPEHRKECKRIAKELKLVTALGRVQVSEVSTPRIDMDDPDLFKTPPKPDCAICMLPMPYGGPKESKYFDCCGKMVCTACALESYRVDVYKSGLENMLPKECCPFCRTMLATKNTDEVAQIESRVKKNDENATFQLAMYYYEGAFGIPKDGIKYFTLLHTAAEQRSSAACYCLAWYYNPRTCSIDPHFNARECGIKPTEEKMMHYYKEAARLGHVQARCDLGLFAFRSNDFTLAHRHWMLSVARGHDLSLENFEDERSDGRISERKFSEIKAAHENGKEEMASIERDRALRADFDFARYCLLFNEEEVEKMKRRSEANKSM